MGAVFAIPFLTAVLVVAAVILAAVVASLLYGAAHAAWGVAHGWRSVNCPRGVLADVQVRARDVTRCSVYDGASPTCRRPCLTQLAHTA